MEKVPGDVFRQLVTEEVPQGIERRLVLHLLGYWRRLQQDQEFPSFDAIEPADIPDMWGHSFVLESIGNEKDPLFCVMGNEIADYCGGSLVGKCVSEAPPNTLVAMATGYIGDVLAKGAPISRGGEFIKPDGTKVLYRSILLPMSDDGETISGLFGAANCREEEQG